MPVSDEELAAALGTPVAGLERRPWPYASSTPMEELRVSGRPPLLFKNLTSTDRPSRPGFLIEPLREVEAYTELLDGLDAPACHGAVVSEDRVWLFLELVDGVPLWQAEGLAPWEAAARWLARLHRRPPVTGAHLLRYDAAQGQQWLDRATALNPGAVPAAVRVAAERAMRRLEAWPAALVHGEFYPANVLIEGPRVRAVDWETAGIGPGLLDLAALTSGSWDASRRRRIVATYRSALDVSPPGFDQALDAARLMIALQWLGWSPGFSPPPTQRHDWAADARRLAGRIA